MFKRSVSGKGQTLTAAFGIGIALALTALSVSPAEARRHYKRHHARVAAGYIAPSYAAIVVDANSGKTLYSHAENELRHPASVTKVMTLYMLFEALDKGKLRLDSDITMSAFAASRAPSKLGLRPGQTIEVEDAIKAVVTKSANDVATAIAEAVAGDEETFADMMTRKARALGMSRTVYRNASGLPNPQQVTTARDLATLGRAIQERYPRYYKYFATHTFYYNGRAYGNHNRLLGRVEGMDGIKTGYTAASGFNLLSSVKRDGHHIVSVVLGGKTARARDQVMANLIDEHLDSGSTNRTTNMVADNSPAERVPDAFERRELERAKLEQDRPKADVKPEPVRMASAAPMQLMTPPAAIPAVAPVEKPRPAFISSAPKAVPASDLSTTSKIDAKRVLDGSTSRPVAASSTGSNTPSNMRWTTGPQGRNALIPPARIGETKMAKVDAKPEYKAAPSKVPELIRPAAARSGWMIQVGATDDASKAGDLLAKAKSNGKGALASAQPFTEKVTKGSETLYRARFAGLQADSAEAACKALKRSGMSCFATKN